MTFDVSKSYWRDTFSNVNTFHQQSFNVLEHYWTCHPDIYQPSLYYQDVSQILDSKTKSFRYALITQVLAKTVNSTFNCLSLQLGTGENNAFDARSLCAKSVTKFESKYLEGILGRSLDPYVSKPLRRTHLSLQDGANIRDKADFIKLHNVLLDIQKGNIEASIILTDIIHLLQDKLLKFQADKTIILQKKILSNKEFEKALYQFMSVSSGGRRYQSIVSAFYKALKDKGLYTNVQTSHVNSSDETSKKPGDVICYENEEISLCVEVKDRKLTDAELSASLNKASQYSVTDLLFIVQKYDLTELQTTLEINSLNVHILTMKEFISSAFSFGNSVTKLWLKHLFTEIDVEDNADFVEIFKNIS